ncbi:protein NRT1/ PTR FAMILY 5.2-like [Cynara cardunculus var. scolymus]|uniref:Major facilitator superfamily domain, general substrate transporter n=1 Tax=Cynara cardunculus var. scolymus TaxID=59895 RepID=A0A103XHS4_CYNCS|nr:protein NRT1/ PTR FAMILY 5.2-like [Cynara cardunculus var. scolymus]KVH91021.1 Major facilitator superfamily domain, general substrate transporter [Cynara cardunculus var. scolymus]
MVRENVEQGREGYTEDGTVDLRGNPILRSKRGAWTACSFVVVYEVFERMAYYGISSNLIIYLTTKLRQGTVRSSNNVTNWVGTIWMTPILGAYLADAVLGRYWTFLISAFIYLAGMCLLTLAVSVSGLKPPTCDSGTDCKKASTLQLAVFFGALYTLAVGTGGTKPNISTIGADQFDDFDPKEKAQKLSFFNWWMFSIFFGTLFANTVLVYIQDNVGWSLGYGLPTLGLLISILIFLAGTPFYRHKIPTGSPFTKMVRVIMVALRNWNLPLPTDPKHLYELDLLEYSKKGKYRIDSTPTLSVLNKAACVRTDAISPPLMPCSVTEVEETKQILRMIPILIATVVPSTMIAQISTLFVKQGTTLERNIGSFEIPPASLAGFVTLSMLIFVVLYDRIFVRIMAKWTKNPRGITLLQRMGTGMVIHIIIMVVASVTDRHRLSVAKDHGVVENGKQVPLSILVLLPQFILMGMADAFLEVAKIEFFYDQAPESMKSLGTSYSMTSLGIGSFFSSFLLSTVSRVTKRNGHKGWILNNLNDSHLDYYYAFFAVLNLFNFIFFLAMAKFYVYKAEVSDSMVILGQELKSTTTTDHHVVAEKEAASRFNLT